jgi:hypothetical protein
MQAILASLLVLFLVPGFPGRCILSGDDMSSPLQDTCKLAKMMKDVITSTKRKASPFEAAKLKSSLPASPHGEKDLHMGSPGAGSCKHLHAWNLKACHDRKQSASSYAKQYEWRRQLSPKLRGNERNSSL